MEIISHFRYKPEDSVRGPDGATHLEKSIARAGLKSGPEQDVVLCIGEMPRSRSPSSWLIRVRAGIWVRLLSFAVRIAIFVFILVVSIILILPGPFLLVASPRILLTPISSGSSDILFVYFDVICTTLSAAVTAASLVAGLKSA